MFFFCCTMNRLSLKNRRVKACENCSKTKMKKVKKFLKTYKKGIAKSTKSGKVYSKWRKVVASGAKWSKTWWHKISVKDGTVI